MKFYIALFSFLAVAMAAPSPGSSDTLENTKRDLCLLGLLDCHDDTTVYYVQPNYGGYYREADVDADAEQ